MKRFLCLSLLSLLCAAPALRAEDAASAAARQETDENIKILRGKIDDLTDAKNALQSRIQSLEREISELRAQLAKPSPNYASADDLKHLAEAIKEVDKKRVEDNKNIIKEISDLGRNLSHSGGHIKETPTVEEPVAPANPDQPTFTYTVKEGDYLSTIAKAYREKGIKVTVDQILAANPGLKATALYPGKKILIPDTRVGSKTDSK